MFREAWFWFSVVWAAASVATLVVILRNAGQ